MCVLRVVGRVDASEKASKRSCSGEDERQYEDAGHERVVHVGEVYGREHVSNTTKVISSSRCIA